VAAAASSSEAAAAAVHGQRSAADVAAERAWEEAEDKGTGGFTGASAASEKSLEAAEETAIEKDGPREDVAVRGDDAVVCFLLCSFFG
jgi:hypothetical protein